MVRIKLQQREPGYDSIEIRNIGKPPATAKKPEKKTDSSETKANEKKVQQLSRSIAKNQQIIHVPIKKPFNPH